VAYYGFGGRRQDHLEGGLRECGCVLQTGETESEGDSSKLSHAQFFARAHIDLNHQGKH